MDHGATDDRRHGCAAQLPAFDDVFRPWELIGVRSRGN